MFGEVADGEMYLTRLGMQVWQEWDRTLELRPEVIEHAFIVMPNHVHGLFTLEADDVESHRNATPRLHRKPRSLGSIISGFKGAVTTWVRRELGDDTFQLWQPGFHDHVVRSQQRFDVIAGYIVDNPRRWEADKENSMNRSTQHSE